MIEGHFSLAPVWADLGPGLPRMNFQICLLVSFPFLEVCLKLIITKLIALNIFPYGLFTIEGTKLFGTVSLKK